MASADLGVKAEAIRAYAQKAKDRELVWWAAELKLDAERKAGQMLAEMDLPASRPKKASHAATLSDYHITRSQSSRWQLSGTVSDRDYRIWIESLKGGLLLREIERRQGIRTDLTSRHSDAKFQGHRAAIASAGLSEPRARDKNYRQSDGCFLMGA